MLCWPPGLRETDGIWAKHWYSEVENSTGFRAYRAATAVVPPQLARVHKECERIYRKLHDLRLR